MTPFPVGMALGRVRPNVGTKFETRDFAVRRALNPQGELRARPAMPEGNQVERAGATGAISRDPLKNMAVRSRGAALGFDVVGQSHEPILTETVTASQYRNDYLPNW
jgi:hypothetical protein